jgi:hypothetical protein
MGLLLLRKPALTNVRSLGAHSRISAAGSRGRALPRLFSLSVARIPLLPRRKQVQIGGAQPALFAAVLVEDPSGFPPSHGGNTGSNPVGDAIKIKNIRQ